MNKLTKSEAIALHRKMWRWIKKETIKRKRKVEKWEYFDEMNIALEDRPLMECYCCEYAAQEGNRCYFRPLDWGEGKSCSGLFGEWDECPADEWERAAELAGKIAELPERKEEKQ